MPRMLIRKNPSDFKTLPLYVEATPEGLSYQSIGMPLNFAQTLQKRRPVTVADSERFSLELANLGVSIRLTLHWQVAITGCWCASAARIAVMWCSS